MALSLVIALALVLGAADLCIAPDAPPVATGNVPPLAILTPLDSLNVSELAAGPSTGNAHETVSNC